MTNENHYLVYRTTHMRTCFYCHNSFSTVFYLRLIKSWACPKCYERNYVRTANKPIINKDALCASVA